MTGPELEFISPAEFEWDEAKSRINAQKHGFDFEDAAAVFYSPVILRRSDRNDEERWIALGPLEGRLAAVVFTRRASVIRIISARRARKNEEREYRQAKVGRPSQRED
jgi:uncharacterized DUF497 family protein